MTGAVIGALRADITLGTASLEQGADRAQRAFDVLKAAANTAAASVEKAGTRFSGGLKTGISSAAASAATLAAEMDRLQAKFDPVFATSKRYEVELGELSRAQSLGVVTGARYEAALTELNAKFLAVGTGAETAGGHIQQLGVRAGGLRANTANIAAQFQDIAVQLAAGTAPMTVALQQGTQLTSVFNSMGGGIRAVGGALLGAFTSLINPISLVTIGVIAFGGAIVQHFTAGREKVTTLSDAVSELKQSTADYAEATKNAALSVQELSVKFGAAAESMHALYQEQKALAELDVGKKTRDLNHSLQETLGNLPRILSQIDQVRANAKDMVMSSDQQRAMKGILDSLIDGLGMTEDAARRVKEALDAAAQAKGPEQTADAWRNVRETIIAAAGGTEHLTDLQLDLLMKMIDVEDAQRSIGAADMSAGIRDASRYTDEFAARIGRVLDMIDDAQKAAAALADRSLDQTYEGATMLKYGSRAPSAAQTTGGRELASIKDQLRGYLYADQVPAEPKKTRGGGGSSAAQKEANDLDREAKALKEKLATATEKYQTEIAKLNAMLKAGKIDQHQYGLAVQALDRDLADSTPLVGDLADAWGQFVSRGFRDFKGFVEAIGSSFRKMIADMVSTALKNRILINIGTAGSGTAATAATGGGGAGGLGSLTTSFLGSFGTGGSGLLGSLGGGTGLLGGLGNALSGGLGNLFNVSANAALAGGGLLAGLGAALPIIGIGAAIFSFFKSKKKLIDAGVSGNLSLSNTEAFDYQTIQKTKFFGLSKKTKTTQTLNAALTDLIGQAVADAAGNVRSLGTSIGATASLGRLNRTFSVSTSGMSADQAQQAILDQVSAFTDQMAEAMLGGSAWTKFAKKGETASQTLTRLSQSLTTVNPTFEALGWTLFGVSKSGAAASSAFADLLGGLDGFKELTSSYYQDFYSTQERTDFTTKKLTESLGKLGLTMPATRDAFRQMVDQAQAAGNTKLVAELLKLAPVFSSVTKSADDLAATLQSDLKKALDALNENDFASMLDFRRAQAAIQYGGVLAPAAVSGSSQALASVAATGQTAGAASVDRLESISTQIAGHVEALRRYVTRWDMDGLPATRTTT